MKNKNNVFDYVNFAYGAGAAVVIMGAMAKFLGWDFANQLFMVGLTTEAIVFLISAFEYKELTKTSPDYKWEKLFPELLTDTGQQKHIVDEFAGVMNEHSSTAAAIAGSLTQLDDAIKQLNTATAQLVQSMNNINNNITKAENDSLKFGQVFNKLQDNITDLNTFYGDMLRVAGRDQNEKAGSQQSAMGNQPDTEY